MPPDPDVITRANLAVFRQRLVEIERELENARRLVGQLDRDRDRILQRIAETERTLY